MVNGEKVESLDISDRGFQYGDGVFETIAIHQSIPLFLSEHFARLVLGCKKLEIPFPDDTLLRAEIDFAKQENSDGVVKIILTRGRCGRGYQPSEATMATRIVSFHSKPEYSETFYQQGVKVTLCRTRLGINRFLAGIKHMNRLEQTLASMEWLNEDFQEGLMLDQDGLIVEGTKSNLFLVKNRIVYTPKIDRCGVAGIIRCLVINSSMDLGLQVKQTMLNLNDLFNSDELFLTNSVITLWPIKQFMEKRFVVGPISRIIQDYLSKKIDSEITQ